MKSATIIKIPIRLISEANNSQHWTKKSKRHKTHKFLVKSFLETYCNTSPPCEILLTRHAPRELDDDNLRTAFKWVRDCIAEFLLGGRPGRMDSDKRLHWTYDQKKTKDKEYFITIELFPMDKPDLA